MVGVRCSRVEREALEAIAAYERRKLSETMRELIREGAAKRGLWPPEAPSRAASAKGAVQAA
jgi:hypothetical protein